MLDVINTVKLHGIHCKNFMSFTDIELTDLEKSKIIFIYSTNATGKSTITSEAPYFSLFGSSLRYSAIKKLLSWGAKPTDDSFSKVTLAVTTVTGDTVYIHVKRNVIKDPRFEIEVENDKNGYFSDLVDITKVSNINNVIKRLLEIDEKKFSILYLKSPFSEKLFESNSNLISSITKANHINELRADFSGIVNDLQAQVKQNKKSIDNRKRTIESIQSDILDKKSKKSKKEENLESLKKCLSMLSKCDAELLDLQSKKQQAQTNLQKRNNALNQQSSNISRVKSELQSLREQYSHLQELIKAGKCSKCFQVIEKATYDTELADIAKKGELLKRELEIAQGTLKETNDAISKINEYTNKVFVLENDLNNSRIKYNSLKASLETQIKEGDVQDKQGQDIISKLKNELTTFNMILTDVTKEYTTMLNVYSKILDKKNKYINQFYNQQIAEFNNVFKSLLVKLTSGKFEDVKVRLDNKPIFNGYIEYEALSTSERKYVDMAFVISYIVYLSTKLKFKTFVLDEFFDNFDLVNIMHIYEVVYEVVEKYDLQFIITTNIANLVVNNVVDHENSLADVKLVDLRKLTGIDDENLEKVYE
jgi:DNA repair exonuclease SbcCD ATPase subunit